MNLIHGYSIIIYHHQTTRSIFSNLPPAMKDAGPWPSKNAAACSQILVGSSTARIIMFSTNKCGFELEKGQKNFFRFDPVNLPRYRWLSCDDQIYLIPSSKLPEETLLLIVLCSSSRTVHPFSEQMAPIRHLCQSAWPQAQQQNSISTSQRSFSQLKHSFLQDTHFIRSKLELQETTANELHDYLEKIIEKQSCSFNKLKSIVLLLCKQLNVLHPNDQTAAMAKQVLAQETQQWQVFTTSLSARIARINTNGTSPICQVPTKRAYKTRKTTLKREERKEHDSGVGNGGADEMRDGEFGGVVKLQGDQGLDYKMRLQQQFLKIREYVQTVLAPMLKEDGNEKIHKKVILNNYIAWNTENGRKILLNDWSQVQMELTVQVKNLMKRVISARKYLQGITFKEQYATKLTLTDRTAPPTDAELWEGNPSGLADPIDQIIGTLKKSGGKGNCSLNEQQENDRLDFALGLK